MQPNVGTVTQHVAKHALHTLWLHFVVCVDECDPSGVTRAAGCIAVSCVCAVTALGRRTHKGRVGVPCRELRLPCCAHFFELIGLETDQAEHHHHSINTASLLRDTVQRAAQQRSPVGASARDCGTNSSVYQRDRRAERFRGAMVFGIPDSGCWTPPP